jgi:hypothetical protein
VDFDGETWRLIREEKGDVRAQRMWNLELKRLLRRKQALERRSAADLAWLKRDAKGGLLHWALAGAPRGDEPPET